MKFHLVLAMLLAAGSMSGQERIELDALIQEALSNNPGLRASRHQIEAIHAGSRRAGLLDDPELMYMREEMPGFRFNEAMFSRIELMQMVPFPSKIAKQSEIANIDTDHAHHEYAERELEVIKDLKSAYFEFWFSRQAVALNDENIRLITQLLQVAKTKFSTGDGALQDVLNATVELARAENKRNTLNQQEHSSRVMLNSILNRRLDDALGEAFLPDTVLPLPSLQVLQERALTRRPMLLHDSLVVEQQRLVLSLARQAYLPDMTFGLQYVTSPVGDFRGWSVRAGITLPFAPWVMGKASSRVEEATASIGKASEDLAASRAMVAASVADAYFKATSLKAQVESYNKVIIKQARQSLNASLTSYQNGATAFMAVIDAYRTLVDLSMEALMTRMQFEQSIAGLERNVGAPLNGHSNMERIER